MNLAIPFVIIFTFIFPFFFVIDSARYITGPGPYWTKVLSEYKSCFWPPKKREILSGRHTDNFPSFKIDLSIRIIATVLISVLVFIDLKKSNANFSNLVTFAIIFLLTYVWVGAIMFLVAVRGYRDV